MNNVYICNTQTGEYTPLGIAKDIEITSTDVTSLGDDIRIFKNGCTLTLNLDALSRFNMARICGISNNRRRYNGLCAIRWRKFK